MGARIRILRRIHCLRNLTNKFIKKRRRRRRRRENQAPFTFHTKQLVDFSKEICLKFMYPFVCNLELFCILEAVWEYEKYKQTCTGFDSLTQKIRQKQIFVLCYNSIIFLTILAGEQHSY
ncbi:hypothetical protein ES332_A12G226700v1 [Gossypium tomentosum]|uniref:Uncharacterized protein n=1 Tax=Gossypium tomentosum TaxID=34277 RepID=A0A5D2MZY9_GOSTO|nr:hypothetical protein ES332_A12G226700v1 [Gossypium tomentosum]